MNSLKYKNNYLYSSVNSARKPIQQATTREHARRGDRSAEGMHAFTSILLAVIICLLLYQAIDGQRLALEESLAAERSGSASLLEQLRQQRARTEEVGGEFKCKYYQFRWGLVFIIFI